MLVTIAKLRCTMLLLAAGLSCIAQDSVPRERPMEDSLSRIVILSKVNSPADRLLLSIASECDRELRRITGRPAPALPLYLIPNSGNRELRQRLCFFGITDTANQLLTTNEVIRAILWRQMLEIRRIPIAHDEIPAWLIAALHQNILEKRTVEASRNRYVTCRTLAEAEKLPPYQSFFDIPIQPELPLFYQLYCSAAACALQLLRGPMPDLPLQLLMNLDPKMTPSEQLAAVMPQQMGDSRQAQQWFNDELRKLVFRLDQPGSYEGTREKLNQIERITVMVPTEDGRYGVKQILIDELPLFVEQYDYGRYNIASLIQEIIYLMHDAPYVLRKSLGGYVSAFNALRQGRMDNFTNEIRAARADFEKNYRYGTSIDAYLGELEGRTMNSGKRLFRYVNTADNNMPPLEFEQQIDDYLKHLLERGHSPPTPSGEKERGVGE